VLAEREATGTRVVVPRSIPRRIGGRYRPIQVIGQGGWGVVYEAQHEITQARLALKVLRADRGDLGAVGLARFRREARISALLGSRHVVRVFDAGIDPDLGNLPFLVMELLQGQSLAKTAGAVPQPPDLVVSWLVQLASALDDAHRVGVVHRDLKPHNLFLQHQGRLKVLDFGVAKVLAEVEADRTVMGPVVGTPLYMSPEQATGSSVGLETDIWAVGICAFRLLTGRDYWTSSGKQLLAEITRAGVRPPSALGFGLGAGFDDWFMKSCAPSPRDRWHSTGEQVEALARALDQAISRAVDLAEHDAPALPPDAIDQLLPESTYEFDRAGERVDARARTDRTSATAMALLSLGAAIGATVALFQKPLPEPHGKAPPPLLAAAVQAQVPLPSSSPAAVSAPVTSPAEPGSGDVPAGKPRPSHAARKRAVPEASPPPPPAVAGALPVEPALHAVHVETNAPDPLAEPH
jgi:serine/threonine-protein kinase